MPTSNATATWDGAIKSGKGRFKGASGAIDAPYSFGTRFEGQPGTNPEELLAAAQAACFSMALSGNLERAGTPPTHIETKAACTVEKSGDGFRITTMKMVVRASVPGADAAAFQKIAEATKDGCPVSLVMKGNLKLEMDAALV
jgi:osmotically inducible protein OsmC